jgi:hypothetical protein
VTALTKIFLPVHSNGRFSKITGYQCWTGMQIVENTCLYIFQRYQIKSSRFTGTVSSWFGLSDSRAKALLHLASNSPRYSIRKPSFFAKVPLKYFRFLVTLYSMYVCYVYLCICFCYGCPWKEMREKHWVREVFRNVIKVSAVSMTAETASAVSMKPLNMLPRSHWVRGSRIFQAIISNISMKNLTMSI